MNCIVFGATSAIAQSLARELIPEYNNFYLFARDQDKLQIIEKDLLARGAKTVSVYQGCFLDQSNLSTNLDLLLASANSLDLLIMAQGILPDQDKCLADYDDFLLQFNVNFNSYIFIITKLLEKFKSQKTGTIVAISSVAGDRGRKSNFAYGTAKASLNTYLQGLRNYLSDYNVHILTVKPGFVDTPMTKSIKKNFLFATPQQIAVGIKIAINKKKEVVYLPWFWRFIMLIINNIPEKIFKKLSL